MNIAFTTKFKAGAFKDRTPADVILKSKDKNKAISDLLGQREFLEKHLSNERYREANKTVIAAIDAAIDQYKSGNLTSPEDSQPDTIDTSIAYTCQFMFGPYKGMSPADAILSSPDPQATVADLREQYRALKNSDIPADMQLASAISVAGQLFKNGKLYHRQSSNPFSDREPQAQGKEYLTKKDNLRKGSIMISYGSKYLCNVAPAFSIHKIRWSVVALETNGQKHWDFYMDLDDFRRFCEDIDSGIARENFLQDREEAIPKAYQFVAGDNGSKRLNIGGGNKGIRINISIQNEGYANTVVPYFSLKDMSFYFKIVAGLIPTSRYFSELAEAFWEGEAERNSYHQ